MKVSQRNIPVVDIHADNVIQYWPALTLAIHSSTFIALDLEMSGIGNRKDTMARCTEERYKAFSEIAKTRSVLSLGISAFQRKTESYFKLNESKGNTETPDRKKHEENTDFIVQTFNIMVLNQESFMVDPSSLRFLVEHGFDFNKHYAKGIPYSRNDLKENKGQCVYSIVNLFVEILKASKPVILHNGILDLVFLYQSFYADLPSTSLTFLADLSEMFPAGIFDTKYIAEYHTDNKATFLNYVFKKSWRENLRHEADMKSCVTIQCFQYPVTADVCYNEVVDKSSMSHGLFIPCEQFAAHGHCPKGMKCEMSHDLDVILDCQQQKKQKKRKRKGRRKAEKPVPPSNTVEDHTQDCQGDASNAPVVVEPRSSENDENSMVTPVAVATHCTNTATGNHRAGFDAFMTGFCMASFLHQFEKSRDLSMVENLPDFANRLNLSGKDIPLKITKSQYSKTSVSHQEAWKKVMSS